MTTPLKTLGAALAIGGVAISAAAPASAQIYRDYGRGNSYDNHWNSGGWNQGNSRNAVDKCSRVAERQASRATNSNARVTDVRDVRNPLGVSERIDAYFAGCLDALDDITRFAHVDPANLVDFGEIPGPRQWQPHWPDDGLPGQEVAIGECQRRVLDRFIEILRRRPVHAVDSGGTRIAIRETSSFFAP